MLLTFSFDASSAAIRSCTLKHSARRRLPTRSAFVPNDFDFFDLPENQHEIIREYAAVHNMEIVEDYSDHGRSGLNIAGWEGLNRLVADVEADEV